MENNARNTVSRKTESAGPPASAEDRALRRPDFAKVGNHQSTGSRQVRSRLLTLALASVVFCAASPALADDVKVKGDSPCPSGYSLATLEEAESGDVCSLLGTWDIVRLAGGGSIDGPGYGCGTRASDDRSLGHALCKTPTTFSVHSGDGHCDSPAQPVSYEVASAHATDACAPLGPWYIARLSDGGSMDGPGYGCGIRPLDERPVGHTLCAEFDFLKVQGDSPCPSGFYYISPEEARSRSDELCELLGTWDIVRLSGGGSMDGPGYGCGIRDFDSRDLGHSLCTDGETACGSE